MFKKFTVENPINEAVDFFANIEGELDSKGNKFYKVRIFLYNNSIDEGGDMSHLSIFLPEGSFKLKDGRYRFHNSLTEIEVKLSIQKELTKVFAKGEF